MKLLFDQNVSPKLASNLADLFPGSAHVDPLGLGQADDADLWQFASVNGFTLVSKDEDFNLMSVSRGAPPKVIWLRMGNCTTTEIEVALRDAHRAIEAFDSDPIAGTLVIR
jgi:predicted nuclease of predicted toxin-antitoxin system